MCARVGGGVCGSELAGRGASLQLLEGGVVADGRRAKEYVPVSCGRLSREDYRVEIANGGLLAILRKAPVGGIGGFCPLRMSELLGQEQHTDGGCKQRQSHSGP